MINQPILQLQNISKGFPGVVALNNVSLDVLLGEIHVLVGENGAGKSTLIKIISGLYQKDRGEYLFNGKEVSQTSPNKIRNLGISTVYQELTLAPELSVAENIFMGNLPSTAWGGVDWNAAYKNAQEILDGLDIKIDAKSKVAKLSVGFRQMVEIARALSLKSKVLILDEPTAVLTNKESEVLFKNMRTLKDRGVAIIYISHRIAEILDLADRITVLRDGEKIDTVDVADVADVDYNDVVRMMVGRDVANQRMGERVKSNPFIKIDDFSSPDGKVKSVSLEVNKGEILGIYGLIGSGRTELARMMFGLNKKKSGKMTMNNQEILIRTQLDAKNAGMGFVPEDRRHQGLVLEMDVGKNICLASHEKLSKYGLINFPAASSGVFA